MKQHILPESKAILYRGAEAILYFDKKEGEKVLVKERVEKRYRLQELDSKIRLQRTKHEISLLSKAKRAGVCVPKVMDFDNIRIILEWLNGKTIKEILNKSEGLELKDIYKKIGENIALLHSAGIMHGDLTTANMILQGNEIYFLDFGLGKFSDRIEDQASDLFLFYEILKSTHLKLLEEAWENVLNAYKQKYVKAEEVLKRLEKIKKRRRYR